MNSLRSQEGYLLIDNRNNPGVSDEMREACGLPPGANRGTVELPTFTCRHCTRVVVMNPLRTRERGYCPGCDHYVCDDCNAARLVHGCRTFNQLAAEIQENAARDILLAT